MKRYALAAAAAGLAAVTTCTAATTASAEPTPSAQSKGIVLTEPGVVYVTTAIEVDVHLKVSSSSTLSGVDTIDETFETDYGSGSGFVVTPDGTVVTASHVVEPDEDEVRQYAANMLFFDKLGDTLGLPPLYEDESPWDRYGLSDDPAIDGLLHQCYDGVACSFDVRPSYAVYSGVQLAGTSASRGLPARVVQSTGFDKTDVAVLKVDGQGMPTVALGDTATTLDSGADVVALGYPGSAVNELPHGTTETTKAFGKVSNVRSVGSSREIEVDIRTEGGMSGGPVLDGTGKVVGLVSYALLRDDGADAQSYVRSVDDIRTALGDAGITPARGEVDDVFGRGMNLFWQHHYGAAAPLLQQAVRLHDGHPQATRYLSTASSKAGTAEDIPVPGTTDEGAPLLWLVIAGVLALTIAAGAGGIVLRRRGGRAIPAAVPPQRSGIDDRRPDDALEPVPAGRIETVAEERLF
jgi:S1-C subfamily serine protease